MSPLQRSFLLALAMSVLTAAGPVQRDTEDAPILSISLGLPGQPSWTPAPSSSWGGTTSSPAGYPTGPPACPTTITTTVTITASSTQPTSTSSTTSSAPAGPTFSCPSEGYNLRAGGTVLEAIDISTGADTVLANTIGDGTPVNAIGYNIIDNTFYAHTITTAQTILHIFRDGTTQSVGQFPTGTSSVNLGDVDLNGHYWGSSHGTEWFEYDFDPASSTYGTLLDSGSSAAPPDGVVVNDWATVPITGPYFYSLVVNGTTGGSAIVRWNSVTHAWERFANYPDLVVDVWGATWGENNGTLYGTNNTGGAIYNFPLLGGGAPFVVSQGPTTGSEDAARCLLNLTP